ncbi:MAG: hypothetical protein Q4F41_12595 [Eubacteriales bacterium]|nr:hypothetical protein [Eubacteriales bacterium]
MTRTQYKKVIKSLTRDELETHLFEMFKSSKAFKDIESSYWSEESNEELLTGLQKRLEKVFWKEQFSLGECKGVLNDYLSRTVDEGTKALMYLAFAAEAAELSAAYGDFGERFYNSLESSAEKFLAYAKLSPDFFSLHEADFENLISTAEPLGYGVSDDLGYMLEDVRMELGYYDDPDEDE